MKKGNAGLRLGSNRLFLFFVSGARPELLPKGIKTKEKRTVVELFNLRIYFENFTMKMNNRGLIYKYIAIKILYLTCKKINYKTK